MLTPTDILDENTIGIFLDAALIFSNIVQIQGLKASIWDWNNAAYSWSMAGIPDSALYNLEKLAEIDTVTFSDYLDIITDPDYKSLYSNKRWSEIKRKLFNNAREYFETQLKNSDERNAIRQRYNAAQACVINGNPDSAFTHLNNLTASNALTLEYADLILKNGTLKELHV